MAELGPAPGVSDARSGADQLHWLSPTTSSLNKLFPLSSSIITHGTEPLLVIHFLLDPTAPLLPLMSTSTSFALKGRCPVDLCLCGHLPFSFLGDLCLACHGGLGNRSGGSRGSRGAEEGMSLTTGFLGEPVLTVSGRQVNPLRLVHLVRSSAPSSQFVAGFCPASYVEK